MLFAVLSVSSFFGYAVANISYGIVLQAHINTQKEQASNAAAAAMASSTVPHLQTMRSEFFQ